MTTIVSKSAVVAALAKAAGIVQPRNTIPILSHVIVSVSGDEITFKASDMDIEITTTAKTEQNDAEWTIAVAAYALKSSLSKATASINLDYNGKTLKVSYGKSEFNLVTLPVDDFPIMANDTYETTFTTDAVSFAEIFDRTKFAQSTEETRYYLNGTYLHSMDGKLTGVATNGAVLARVSTEIAQDIPNGVIVPTKTGNEIAKQVSGDVVVSVSLGKIKIEADGLSIVSKVIDGTFPDYIRVIPSGNNDVMSARNKDMKDAVARVVSMADDKARRVGLIIGGDSCLMSAKGAEGYAKDEIAIEYTGTGLDIGFNSKYLNDVFGQCGDGLVMIGFKSNEEPALITCEGDTRFTAVVMPMR